MVHLKTDSPDLYHFTLLVIELYGLELLEYSENIHTQESIKPELLIKTHYEGLDIAQSNRIHYLCFKLNKELSVEIDEILKQHLREPSID